MITTRNRLITATTLLSIAWLTTTSASEPWVVDYDNSTLAFEVSYDGYPIEGQFNDYQAQIVFDKADLASAGFNVTIAPASADTDDEERDEILVEEDWFHVEQFPESEFVASNFRVAGDGYIADGRLTLKGVEKAIEFPFQWTETEGGVKLTAEVSLDRRWFKVGAGDWAEDQTIGFMVPVKVDLKLTPSEAR